MRTMHIKIKRVPDLKITRFFWENVDFVEYVDFTIGLGYSYFRVINLSWI